MKTIDQEIERITQRQIARLLAFLQPLQIPAIQEDAIKKYFHIAKNDIINAIGEMKNGQEKDFNR